MGLCSNRQKYKISGAAGPTMCLPLRNPEIPNGLWLPQGKILSNVIVGVQGLSYIMFGDVIGDH